MTTTNKTDNTNAVNSIVTDVTAFLDGTTKAKRALPHMTVALVTAHRDSTDPANTVIVANTLPEDDMNTNGVVYDDLLQWALNTNGVASDTHKATVTETKRRLLSSSPKGNTLLASIASNAAKIKELSKSEDVFKIAEVNKLSAQRDDDTKTKNTALKGIERAVFAYIYAVENPMRGAFNTLAMPARGTVATYEQTSEDGEKTVTVNAPLSTWANSLKVDYIKWNMTEAEIAEAAATASTDDDAVTEDRAPQQGNETAAQVAVNGVLATDGGEKALLERATSIVARYDDETAPKGETRDQLLSLFSGLSHIFTASQLEAFDKKEGNKKDVA